MSKLLAALKSNLTQVSLLIVAGVLLFTHFHQPASTGPVPPVVVHDPVVLGLGKDYRAAFLAAGKAQLDAVAGGKFSSTADVTAAQAKALDSGLKAAWAPVAAEATRRFGVVDASPRPTDAVQAFYRDLVAGGRWDR